MHWYCSTLVHIFTRGRNRNTTAFVFNNKRFYKLYNVCDVWNNKSSPCTAIDILYYKTETVLMFSMYWFIFK